MLLDVQYMHVFQYNVSIHVLYLSTPKQFQEVFRFTYTACFNKYVPKSL